ncbi:uncharacterized protein LOC62_08G009850 [Vanrija pseudolonga]|uniref:Uncharacterized protein n=1 Tax=Vanrija pseudolonga TaxID=143232 RepID=A0AAF0YGU5_9TREE|nr:hypothetical protein LOC62_08G009850 [Vanrija pseudolonga]
MLRSTLCLTGVRLPIVIMLALKGVDSLLHLLRYLLFLATGLIALMNAVVLALSVITRVLYLSGEPRAWDEAEVAHTPLPGNEAILHGLQSTDRTDLKRRRRLLEVAVSQNVAFLERLEREYAREAGLVVSANVETLREIVRRDLAALRRVAGVFTNRFGANDAVGPEKVDV